MIVYWVSFVNVMANDWHFIFESVMVYETKQEKKRWEKDVHQWCDSCKDTNASNVESHRRTPHTKDINDHTVPFLLRSLHSIHINFFITTTTERYNDHLTAWLSATWGRPVCTKQQSNSRPHYQHNKITNIIINILRESDEKKEEEKKRRRRIA